MISCCRAVMRRRTAQRSQIKHLIVPSECTLGRTRQGSRGKKARGYLRNAGMHRRCAAESLWRRHFAGIVVEGNTHKRRMSAPRLLLISCGANHDYPATWTSCGRSRRPRIRGSSDPCRVRGHGYAARVNSESWNQATHAGRSLPIKIGPRALLRTRCESPAHDVSALYRKSNTHIQGCR